MSYLIDLNYLAHCEHTDVNIYILLIEPLFNIQCPQVWEVLYRLQRPVLRHKSNTGPRAMVTKSSNPAAAHKALHWEHCREEQPGRLCSEHISVSAKEKAEVIFDLQPCLNATCPRLHRAITLVRKREAARCRNWRRPFTIQGASAEAGRWSGWRWFVIEAFYVFRPALHQSY